MPEHFAFKRGILTADTVLGFNHSNTQMVAFCEVFIHVSLVLGIFIGSVFLKIPIQLFREIEKKSYLKIHTETQGAKMMSNERTVKSCHRPSFR